MNYEHNKTTPLFSLSYFFLSYSPEYNWLRCKIKIPAQRPNWKTAGEVDEKE